MFIAVAITAPKANKFYRLFFRKLKILIYSTWLIHNYQLYTCTLTILKSIELFLVSLSDGTSFIFALLHDLVAT